MGKAIGGITRTLFGGGTSRQQSTQSSQLDPRMFDMFDQNRQRATGVANNLGVRQFADFTPDFYTGRDQIMSTIGGPGQRSVQAAQQAAQRATNFRAPTISGVGYDANVADRGDIRDVAGGSFLNANIGDYMNPFLNLVAGNTISDMDRARQMTQMQNADAATAARAFGGSRQGVLEAETNRGFFDRLGNTLGGLYATGFDAASNMAMSDMDRALAANLANQGVDQNVIMANMQALNQADQFGATAQNAASVANQQALLNANQQRLAATGMLGDLGNVGQQMALQSGEAATNLGFVQQQLDQARLDAIRSLPLERQAIINEALGINVGGGSGMVSTGQSSGSSSQQTGIVPGLTGMFSGGANSAISGLSGFLGFSDIRMKENVERVENPLDKINQLTGYSYNYKGSDEPAAGVMAQDVEKVLPNAVGVNDGNGMKMVDYAAVTGLLVEAVNELANKQGKKTKRG